MADLTKAEYSAKYNSALAQVEDAKLMVSESQMALNSAETRLNSAIISKVDPNTKTALTPELQLKLQQDVDTEKNNLAVDNAILAGAQQQLDAVKAENPALASQTNAKDTATGSTSQTTSDAPQPQPAANTVTDEEKQNIKSADAQNDAAMPPPITTFDENGNEIAVPEETNQSDLEVPADQNTGSTTGASANQQDDKINPIPNPLHNFSTYTYNLSLHILPIDTYTEMQKDGKYVIDGERVLIASAGRKNDQTFARNKNWTEDFYFEHLNMTTVMGLNARTKGSNAINLEFAVIEPYGISLLDRLIKTCDDFAIESYIKVPYMLQIDFFGYDDKNHNPQWIGLAQRLIPIAILDMTITFDTRGTVYKFSAVPYNHSALSELNANLPTTTNIKSVGTVRSFFSIDQSEINELVGAVKNTAQKNKRQLAIEQAVKDKREAHKNYLKQLEEWKAKNPNLANDPRFAGIENVGFTNGRKPPTDLIKSKFPTPVPALPEDQAAAEAQVAKEYDQAAAKEVIYASEIDASGLGTALNTYQEFLHQEYELQDRPVTYSFTFDDVIGNSEITESFLIDHTRKDVTKKTDTAVDNKQENPTQATGQITGFTTNNGGAATGVIRARGRGATANANTTTSSATTTTASSTQTNASSTSYSASINQSVTFNQGTSVIDLINSILKGSKYIQDQIKVKYQEAGISYDKEQKAAYENYQKQLEQWKRDHPEIIKSAEWRNVGFTAGARIPTELKNLGYPTPVPEPKSLSTNDQAKADKIEQEFEPYNHFKIIPTVYLKKFDPIRNDFCKEVNFHVQQYKVRGLRFPDIKKGTRPRDIDCVKQYNYYFTGQNTDILDLKINFDALFYTALTARVNRHQNSDIKSGNSTANPGENKPDKDSSTGKEKELKNSKIWPATVQFVPNVPGANKMTQEQAEAMRANDLFGNLYSRAEGDMLNVDLEIVGDPTYIQTEEFTLNPQRKEDYLDKSDLRLINNGSLVINDGDLLIKLEFKMPIDIDTETGLIKDDVSLRKTKDEKSVFTGIYRINVIDHVFQNGVFKQKLQLSRMYNDPQSYEKDNNPKPNSERPNSQVAESTVKTIEQPKDQSLTDAAKEKTSDSVLPSPPPLPVPGVPALPQQVQVSTATGAATTTIIGSDKVVTVTSSVTETVSGGGSTTTRAVIDPVTGKTTGFEVVRQEAEQVDRNALAAQADKLNSDEIERLQKANKNEAPISEGDW